ncbi:MAG: hypothetical protein GF335_04035 [Candidatus Moranbacteria bacterium]|nr:hypothetical protein [Candidatus Moranbacteria bacterium]
MEYYQVSLFIGGVIGLTSGFLVYLNDKKNPINRKWFWVNMLTALWSFGYLGMISAQTVEMAWISNWILHAFAIFIPPMFLDFVLTITKKRWIKNYKNFLISIYILAFIFTPLNFTKLFIKDMLPKHVFNYVCDAGPLYMVYTIYFWLSIFVCALILIDSIKKEKGLLSQQIRYILFAEIAGFIGGGSVFFITFNINIPPYTLVLFSFHPLIITYAIMRHRLMDIKFVFKKIYVLISLALFLYISFYAVSIIEIKFFDSIFNPKSFFIGTIFSIITAFFLLPLLNKIEKMTDQLFFEGKNPKKIRVLPRINS